ncbi:DUF6056 family protein [Hymenobacter rubidus]|uniref:DUF6056 family protein n=1 Tax=Hymenobacter rubidus TaxID=1441626 RepID=UPI00191CF6C3|nr:DUF6056 family protein [Hymenobacter rubidus]
MPFATLLLALLPFLGLMLFAQPAIDDFDNAATVARLGRWGAQWYWYTHWSGRFVVIGVSTLLNPLSLMERHGAAPAGLWVLRGALITLALSLVLALQQLFRALQLVLAPADELHGHSFSWGAALAVAILSLNALPEPFSLLFWYSGALNYGLPLVFTLGFAAALLRAGRLPPGARGRGRWAGLATLSLIGAVGGGEVAMLCCGVLLAGALLWPRAQATAASAGFRQLRALWVGVFFITAGVLVGAPGNRERHGMADPDPAGPYHRWLLLGPHTALATARLAARPPVAGAALLLAVAVLGTASAGRVRPATSRRELGLVLGGFALLNCAGVAFLKAFYLHDMWVEALPGRVVNVLVVQLLVSTTALALWARERLPGRLPEWRGRALHPALGALGLLLLLTGQTRQAWQELLFMAPDYARQMQARYNLLNAAHRRGRQAAAVVPPLRLPQVWGLLAPIPSARQRADVHVELFEDARQKNNLFLAHYYGIRSVRLSEPPPLPQP